MEGNRREWQSKGEPTALSLVERQQEGVPVEGRTHCTALWKCNRRDFQWKFENSLHCLVEGNRREWQWKGEVTALPSGMQQEGVAVEGRTHCTALWKATGGSGSGRENSLHCLVEGNRREWQWKGELTALP